MPGEVEGGGRDVPFEGVVRFRLLVPGTKELVVRHLPHVGLDGIGDVVRKAAVSMMPVRVKDEVTPFLRMELQVEVTKTSQPHVCLWSILPKIIKLYIEKLNHLTNKKNLFSFKNGLASWMNNHKDDKIEHLIALSERSRCDCHLVSSASAVWKTSRVKYHLLRQQLQKANPYWK